MKNSYEDFLLTEDFVDPWDVHFGKREADIEFKNIKLRVGSKPTLKNLHESYKQLNKEIPDELAGLSEKDLWIVEYAVSVQEDINEGFRQISSLIFEVNYLNDDLNIQNILPDTKFKEIINGNLSLTSEGEIGASAKLPDNLLLLHYCDTIGLTAKSSAELMAGFKANASFRILTSEILASGKNDNFGIWRFNRHQNPLLGDITMIHVLAIPEVVFKNNSGIEIELRASVQLSVKGIKMFHQKRMTDWLSIKLEP